LTLMLRRALLLILALAWPMSQASAQLTVQILRGMADSVPIAIVPLAWEGTDAAPWDVAATVQSDLERSGRFRPLAREQLIEQPRTASEVDAAADTDPPAEVAATTSAGRKRATRFSSRECCTSDSTWSERSTVTSVPRSM